MASDSSTRLPGASAHDPKLELLAQLLGDQAHNRFGSARTINPRPAGILAPASFSQERLWFLQQWASAEPVYNITRAFRLKGTLDVSALKRSATAILQRHEVLRTIFAHDADRLVQQVLLPATSALRIIDMRQQARKRREAGIKRFIDTEARHRFDLAAEPPVRLSLVRLGGRDHVLVLSAHQIVFDGRSLDIFYREIEALYVKSGAAEAVNLAELPIQYGDYAHWQRQTMNDAALAPHVAYWKGQLSGVLPVLELPAVRSRPALAHLKGARKKLNLDRSMTAALKDFSARSANSLFVTLMAAFNVLLMRYSAQEDIIVGFPVTNRNREELANLIGSFVNTLPLRSDLSGDPTFRALLARIRSGVQGALAHHELPFERLVDELKLTRDFSRTPIFQSFFTFQNTLPAELNLAGIRTTSIDCYGGGAKFDLTLALGEKDGRLSGFFEYSVGLFDDDMIDRMIGNFSTLLKGIIADPDRPISRLPIMDAKERRRVLVEFNRTRRQYGEACVPQLFETQARRTPGARAVVHGAEHLSYDQLNRRSNRLAHYLHRLGVGRGSVVGICLERSVDMVVALMAVLKAGAAYLPLDPDYPADRLAFILADANARFLLTQGKLTQISQLRIVAPSTKIFCLDETSSEITKASDRNLSTGVQRDDLAYVIYTSGSTGAPKGVEIEHGSLVNCLASMRGQLKLSKRDVWLAVTTISFDIAAAELFLPLLSGGKLVIASREDARDGERLGKRIAQCHATVMQATPSTWRLLLEAGWQGVRKLTMISGGEALPRQLADRLLSCGEALWNFYGPTETTIWSTGRQVVAGEGQVPIGCPMANTQVYVLDAQLQPMPVGVTGELYIGGAGVARGYLNRPELSAARFIPNPFVKNSTARLYRTGDLVTYRADGNLEFLGRSDDQVKIRGHRVELGEIEVALGRHPLVRECTVQALMVGPDPKFQISDTGSPSWDSDAQLVAYIVPKKTNFPDSAEVQKFLRQTLPEFMVPALFVILDSLPLTANGKVDRKALPAPGVAPRPMAAGFRTPCGEIEELIAQAWREVLGLDEIGADDNFFDLGGHSLLATRVVARLRVNFNVELSLRKVFELPTIAALAVHVDELRRARTGAASEAIVPVARGGNLPLSSAQQRLWFLHKLDPASSAYNIPAAHRIHGALNVDALASALGEVVARHDSLRTAIVEIDGQPVQRILPKVVLQMPLTDLSQFAAEQAEAELTRLVREAAQLPYDLGRAPLMRAQLLRIGAEDHVLILNLHHIIADASSLVDFYRELAILYEAFADAKPSGLRALPVQCADYASWQHQWLESQEANVSLAYWRRQLEGSAPLDLPADYERPVLQSYRGARVARRLTVDMTRGLKKLSQRSGATLFMTLLTGFTILLARLSGRDDIVVGSTIAGRNRAELIGLIGFFINALALRVDLSGKPSFTDLVARVREVCLDAFAHQDVPFEKIVEALNPERDLSRNPLFQVMLNSNEISDRALKLKDCQIEKLFEVEPAAKFDLVLYAPEIGGSLELAMVYNADLFSHTRVSIYLDQLVFLLEQVVLAPEQSIERLSLLTPSTRAVLPDPAVSLDDGWRGAVNELISQQAQNDPERLAVIDMSASWSYRDVDEQSNRLANYFVSSGIQRGEVIGIYAQRSASLVVALLGALKAGAVFVVLDPAYPADRLLDYLRIAGPKGWLQLEPASELPTALADFLDAAQLNCRLSLPRGKIEIAKVLCPFSTTAPNITICADDPAYIAFTSGSTGQPKGVLCRHGPMSYFLPWQEQQFKLTNSDRYCLLSGLGYNHLQREVFTALSSGATLCIPTEVEVKSPEQLTAWLHELEITILHLTPAFGRLLQTAASAPLASLRRIFFGGDLLTRQDAAAMRRLAPNAEIISFYGATETQRAVGYFTIEDDEADDMTRDKSILPTGKGAPAVQLLLLTPSGQLAGVGELGDLYLRSPHLALGYVGDDDLTAANFIVNPFTGAARDRLYRTGEMGRYRPDGNMEWVGRRDRRVSIRGFRVELAEVESALLQHATVRAAAVVENSKLKIQNSKLSEQLTAYVVADDSGRNLISELRAFLAAKLPHYMVPAEFVRVERLPLNPNGKIDYHALPAPRRRRAAQTSFDAPCSATEQTLAAIFAEVLAIERVGRQDNFFHCGGHSLLAAQAAARIRQSLQVGLDLRVFFEAPTVADLAKRLEAMRGATPSESEREEIEL